MNNGWNPVVIAGVAIASLGVALAFATLTITKPLLTISDGLALSLIWWGALNNPIRSVVASLLSIQWLQASAKVWIANVLGISLSEPSTTSFTPTLQFVVTPHTPAAIALALAAIAAVSLGTRILAPKLQLRAADFSSFAPERLVLIYLPLLFVSEVMGRWFGSGLEQLLLTIGALRFAPIVLLIGVWFYTRRGGLALAAVCGTEVTIGLLGFFSDWKSILVIGAITVLSLAGNAWRRSLPLLISGVASMLLIGTVWTIIKPSYRETLNGGTGQQIIMISPEEQRAALSAGLGRVRPEDLSDGFLKLLMRISYVDYLDDVLGVVPAQMEYQNGALWVEAIQQVVTPRFLFPNKPPLPSDSERTMRFTGLEMASGNRGTSISIGYVGDSYIDFGIAGALLIPFLLGLAYSIGTRVLVAQSRAHNPGIALALTISFLWPAQLFETSNVKLVGGIGWGLAACLLFALAWPHIQPFLVAPGQPTPTSVPLVDTR